MGHRSVGDLADDLKSLSLRSPTVAPKNSVARRTVGGELSPPSPAEEGAAELARVRRKKDFKSLERVNGRLINVLEGLELHAVVFSPAEQRRIVDCVYDFLEKGRTGQLRGMFIIFIILIGYMIATVFWEQKCCASMF